ncbi:PREDICTED: uncharacterized protein LOC109162703 [Ipomoea nil]|uniref:uncharacterized protein LOC109162703 n=1 Tax=Ipomoea nil TaxID=35883 RepID=UPI00090156B3|nr:PREDICTED: uncharacterized protein LOC109162703 [Ipomoea nil]
MEGVEIHQSVEGQTTTTSCETTAEQPKAPPESQSRKPSFKETVTGVTQESSEADDIDSDDDEVDMDEDPECPEITLTKADKIRMRKPWRQSLIVKVFGRKVGYTALARRLHAVWRPKARMEIISLDDFYHVVRFWSVEDYEFAKYGGPWTVMDHYLIVQDWKPYFDPKADKTERVLVWVRFPDMSVEFYDYQTIMRLGRKIGEPKYVDESTSIVSKGRFARMCVEVDIAKPLLSKYTAGRKVKRIEYEGLYQICFHCGIYGHQAEQCEAKNKEEGGAETANDGGGAPGEVDGETNKENNTSLVIRPEIVERFGSWMIAPKRQYRSNNAQYGRNIHKDGKDVPGTSKSNGNLPNAARIKSNAKGKQKEAENQGISIASRFAPLREENEEQIDVEINESNGEDNGATFNNKGNNNKDKGKRPNVQITEKQLANDMSTSNRSKQPSKQTQVTPSSNANTSRKNTKSNQAAAEETHTVARGNLRDKSSVSTILFNDQLTPPMQGILEGSSLEHHGDPPDPIEVNMEDEPWHECDDEPGSGGTPKGGAT